MDIHLLVPISQRPERPIIVNKCKGKIMKNNKRLHKHFQLLTLLKVSFYLFSLSIWSWSYDSWIDNYMYLCNQCLLPLTLWVWTPFISRCTRYNIMWKSLQWLATGWWFSPSIQVSSTNKTDCHNITEILLKVALNTITLF